MPLFASLSQLAARIGRDSTDPAFIAAGESALAAASAAIQQWTCQTLALVEDDRVTLVGGHTTIGVPQLPVVELEVELDGQPFDGWQLETNGLLYRTDLCPWPDLVTITYTHGYETIPDAIVDVCLSLAARILTNPAGMRSQQIDDYAYTVADPTGSGALTLQEKANLAGYRVAMGSPVVALTGGDES